VAQYTKFGKTVVLLGHSKGGTDAAAACAMYWSELKEKVRGLIMLQAPYGGTPLAADLLGGGQFGALNSVFLGKLASFSNPDVSAFTADISGMPRSSIKLNTNDLTFLLHNKFITLQINTS